MRLHPASGLASLPLDQDGTSLDADLLSALAARVDAIDDLVRTTTAVVDEKALKELRRTIEALSKRDPKFEERVTNKVDVLADRIETVAKTVSTASASVAANDGEIAQLRRELEASLARVNTAIMEAGRGTDPAELVEIRRTLDDLAKALEAAHATRSGKPGRRAGRKVRARLAAGRLCVLDRIDNCLRSCGSRR